MTGEPAWPSEDPTVLAERVQALQALVVEQTRIIAELRDENERLRARVAELEGRLRADSRTSSKPPSSDGLRKPPRPARPRQPGARKPGKQPGSPGATLLQVDQPDERRVHVPLVCDGCGGELAGAPVVGVVYRQVHDLPEVRVHVTEHQAQRRRCGCGQVTTASFPAGVGAPVVYGPGVRALGCYLLVGQHLPVERAAELLGEVLGVPVATGTLSGLTAQAAGGWKQEASSRGCASCLPPAQSSTPMRRPRGWPGSATGCTRPPPGSSPGRACMPSAASRGWTRSACCPATGGHRA